MMSLERIHGLKPGRKTDGAIAHLMGLPLNVRSVHVCPDCGWETEDLDTSSRCQACWANGDRVTMSDSVETWDFHPSTDIGDAFRVLQMPNIQDSHQIGVFPTSFGSWVARPFMPGSGICTAQEETPEMAICRCVMLTYFYREATEL